MIHEKGRLTIMSLLAASPELSFTELRDTLGMTDGNLTTHIRTLQEAGYVSVAKSYQNNRPLTTCCLTAAGPQGFHRLHQPAGADRPANQDLNKFNFEQNMKPRGLLLCDTKLIDENNCTSPSPRGEGWGEGRTLIDSGTERMKIIRAEHLGMCFGVRDAIALADARPAPPRR